MSKIAANTRKPVSLDFEDIQGIIIYGYGHLPLAKYMMLEVKEPKKARDWLKAILPDIQDSSDKYDPGTPSLNIAFTCHGFKEMGLDDSLTNQFSLEFIEDMDTPHRNRILGDIGESASKNWKWGGKQRKENTVHIMLALFAYDEKMMGDFYAKHKALIDKGGISVVTELEGLTLKDRKEHFGFRDGISQPALVGTHRQKFNHFNNWVVPGEFLLGYQDGYDQFTTRPILVKEADPENILPDVNPKDTDNVGMKDFGKNGSYLVFRQLKQNVKEFWNYMDAQTNHEESATNKEEMVKLASKMVGRWTNGAPLVKFPDKEPEGLSNDDDFGYKEDLQGHNCPFGSHLRRSNPRNFLTESANSSEEKALEESSEIIARHRIIRRGRPYGRPLTETMNPEEVLKTPEDGVERGLQFLAFNVNISRQFEFVQHTWMNNPKFAELYADPDPIAGAQNTEEPETGNFILPSCPIHQRYKNIPQFVHTVGGSYFFMPGIKAIRYLAEL